MAGQPEKLRHVFAGIVPEGTAVPDAHRHLEKIM
jgi:hypothetical protein